MNATLLHGDTKEVLKGLPANMFRTCVTSPPYYGLRDYGTAKWNGGDPNCKHTVGSGDNDNLKPDVTRPERNGDKRQFCQKCGAIRIDSQIGLEATPEQYVENLVHVFREVWRVLADDGTLWLNIGDSYWGGKGQSSQAWSTEHQDRDTLQKAQHQITGKGETRPTDGRHPVIKPKDLIGIPWMIAFALRADGWYLRSEIIWHKRNPMPESVRDRPTKAHEQIFLLSKSKKYYYDYKAILEPANYDGRKDTMMKGSKKYANGFAPADTTTNTVHVKGHERWRWKNLQEDGQRPHTIHEKRAKGLKDEVFAVRNKRSVWTVSTKPFKGAHFAVFPPDLIRPCILAGSAEGDYVLDPFNGSGTTGVVSLEHGRNYYGIDLNEEYLEISRSRLAGVQLRGIE